MVRVYVKGSVLERINNADLLERIILVYISSAYPTIYTVKLTKSQYTIHS